MVPRVNSQDLCQTLGSCGFCCRDSMKSIPMVKDNRHRSFLSLRTLMDTSGEIWSEDEFNHVQHALKNRILED